MPHEIAGHAHEEGKRFKARLVLHDVENGNAIAPIKNLPGAHGVFNLSANDHLGLDGRARVMVRIDGGTWKYVP